MKGSVERLPDSEQFLMNNGCVPGESQYHQQLKEQDISEVNRKYFDVHHSLLGVMKY
jgi:hypothetical protein